MTKEELLSLQLKIRQLKEKGKDTAVLTEQLETEAIAHLRSTHPELSRLIDENHRLLANSNIRVRVYKENSGMMTTHAVQLSGKMHKNGFIYVKTDLIESPFSNLFAKKQHPTHFKGLILWNGNMRIDATKRKFQLIGSRVPEEYRGTINQAGTVDLTIVKSRFDWFGEDYMQQLLLDPFNGDDSKRQQFIENVFKVKQIIAEYLEEVSPESNPPS